MNDFCYTPEENPEESLVISNLHLLTEEVKLTGLSSMLY
jgi:hypothetical protein